MGNLAVDVTLEEIAAKLCWVSRNTVKTQLHNAYRKIDVSTRSRCHRLGGGCRPLLNTWRSGCWEPERTVWSSRLLHWIRVPPAGGAGAT